MKLCQRPHAGVQDELHRPAFPYKFKIKASGCPNDCVAAIARADLSIIGTWKDDIRMTRRRSPNTPRGGLDIRATSCGRCPTRCMSWDGKKLTIDNANCVRCMHCINAMPKALSPGTRPGRGHLSARKAPDRRAALSSRRCWCPS